MWLLTGDLLFAIFFKRYHWKIHGRVRGEERASRLQPFVSRSDDGVKHALPQKNIPHPGCYVEGRRDIYIQEGEILNERRVFTRNERDYLSMNCFKRLTIQKRWCRLCRGDRDPQPRTGSPPPRQKGRCSPPDSSHAEPCLCTLRHTP